MRRSPPVLHQPRSGVEGGGDASDMGGKFGAFSAFRQMDGHALGRE